MIHLLLAIIYLAFISLGLPDAVLGAAWPSIYPQFGVPVSYMGVISMIIAFGTVVSSLQSDRLIRALGTGKVTAISVGMTAAALFGFSISSAFWKVICQGCFLHDISPYIKKPNKHAKISLNITSFANIIIEKPTNFCYTYFYN